MVGRVSQVALAPDVEPDDEDAEDVREEEDERVRRGPLAGAGDEDVPDAAARIGLDGLLKLFGAVRRQRHRHAEERGDVEADEDDQQQPVERVTPDEEGALRAAAEEHEEEAADGVGHQDVAPPQPERVHEADEHESRHAAARRTTTPWPRLAARSIWIAKPTPKSVAKMVMNLPLTNQSTSAWAMRSGIQVHIRLGRM